MVDTSPLIIFFLGEFDKNKQTNFIEKWTKGNKSYTSTDYIFLKKFLDGSPFEKLCITPHIFHEFYKHIQQVLGNRLFYEFFDYNIDFLMVLKEEYVDKNNIMSHPFFKKLEIGEHSLYLVKEKDKPCCILTDEERQLKPCFEDDKEVLLILVKDAIFQMMNAQ